MKKSKQIPDYLSLDLPTPESPLLEAPLSENGLADCFEMSEAYLKALWKDPKFWERQKEKFKGFDEPFEM